MTYATHTDHGEVVLPVCGQVMAGYSTAQITI